MFDFAILWVILVMRLFVSEPFSIPASSMTPNLVVGDIVIVSKWAYGYGPFSTKFKSSFKRNGKYQPQRGEIAVFRHPKQTDNDYIKRVIGLPGETVQLKKGRLFINGKLIKQERIDDYEMKSPAGNKRSVEQFIETLPNGEAYRILNLRDGLQTDDTQLFTVPEGHYFVLGDHRDNSSDSRFNMGFVSLDNFIGPVLSVIYDKSSGYFPDNRKLHP